jgi:hypothetical protein
VVVEAGERVERLADPGPGLAVRDDAEVAGDDGGPHGAADVGRRRVRRPAGRREVAGDVVGDQPGPGVGHRDHRAPGVARVSVQHAVAGPIAGDRGGAATEDDGDGEQGDE